MLLAEDRHPQRSGHLSYPEIVSVRCGPSPQKLGKVRARIQAAQTPGCSALVVTKAELDLLCLFLAFGFRPSG